VKACPANVKNLIRLVKYWKKQNVTSVYKREIPNSYVIELITIHLCEGSSGWFGTYDTLKAFHSVMEALENYRSLNVIWTKHYSRYDLPTQIQQERYE
jgi:acid phosphatase class B